MLNPSDLYEVDPAIAAQLEARPPDGSGPVLVHAVRGFVDAGSAGLLLAEHVTDELPSTRLVTFDVDQLLDYRSRRPMMTFDASTWSAYAEPELVIDLVDDVNESRSCSCTGSSPTSSGSATSPPSGRSSSASTSR